MLRDIFATLNRESEADRAVVFTMLVETRGSTPQKAGAAMVVRADGSQVGTLGGGCVEAEVKRNALRQLDAAGPSLMTFQLDNDYGWDDGLICGGRMTVLVDPEPAQRTEFYRRYQDLLSSGTGCTEAVILDEQSTGIPAGSRLLFDAEGRLVATTLTQSPPALTDLRPLSDRPRPYVAEGISYLPQLPRCRLVIVGAGHVGQKVAELAADVDFAVWVLDDREEFCNATRFPEATRLIVGPIEDTVAALEVDRNTFCIIVTRGHNHDEQALFHLAETSAGYVGMIGSKRKIRLILDDLRREGISEAALSHVHAPLGFDIGSQTVPEIAISIVAELIACRNLPAGHDTPARTTGRSSISCD